MQPALTLSVVPAVDARVVFAATELPEMAIATLLLTLLLRLLHQEEEAAAKLLGLPPPKEVRCEVPCCVALCREKKT